MVIKQSFVYAITVTGRDLDFETTICKLLVNKQSGWVSNEQVEVAGCPVTSKLTITTSLQLIRCRVSCDVRV